MFRKKTQHGETPRIETWIEWNMQKIEKREDIPILISLIRHRRRKSTRINRDVVGMVLELKLRPLLGPKNWEPVIIGLMVFCACVVLSTISTGEVSLMVASPVTSSGVPLSHIEQAKMTKSRKSAASVAAQRELHRAQTLAALVKTATESLNKVEATAKRATARAKKQEEAVLALKAKAGQFAGPNSLGLENQLAVAQRSAKQQQAVLLHRQGSLSEQEKQNVYAETQANNLVRQASIQVSQLQQKANSDLAQATSNQQAADNDAALQRNAEAQEQPILAAIAKIQSQVNKDKLVMDRAIRHEREISRNAQTAALEKSLEATQTRRHDRNKAERVLNRAVAREQQLENGPDHLKKKLSAADSAALAKAQQAVKQAQAKLAAAYSESVSTGAAHVYRPVDVHNTPQYRAARKAENKATSVVTRDMALLHAKQTVLQRLETTASGDGAREARNMRLVQMLRARAQREQSAILLARGRATAAQQQAKQDQTAVSQIQSQVAGAAAQIKASRTNRQHLLGQLTKRELSQKQSAAQGEAAQRQLGVAAELEAALQKKAAFDYGLVASKANEVQELKQSLQQASDRASQLYAEAAAAEKRADDIDAQSKTEDNTEMDVAPAAVPSVAPAAGYSNLPTMP